MHAKKHVHSEVLNRIGLNIPTYKMEYESPELHEYGSVESITEGDGTNKSGSDSDEYSGTTPLTGSVT